MTLPFRSLTPSALVLSLAAFTASLPALAHAQAAENAIRTVPFANSYPTGFPPRDGVWSPDGKRLTFLATDAQIGQPGDIVEIDAGTSKGSVLATAAQLSRLGSAEINEKDADHRSRYNMSSFLWADDSKHLLLDQGGKLWLYDIAAGTGVLVVDTGAGSGDDPKFSPDAKQVSYLRNHNLYVHPVADAGAKETALTNDSAATLLNGEVDWVYLEELDVRSNYFWSPDSSAIAYLQADEVKVPEYPISDFIPLHATIDQQRYPQPGDPNPAVRVGIVPVAGGATKWIDLPFSPGNDYIPRFGWVDVHTVYIETMKRSQKERSLYLADTLTGQIREVYTDTDPKYLNFDYDVTILPHGRFVASSWRDGCTHLYLYKFDEKHPLAGPAKLVRGLTPGEFDVASVDGFDAKTESLFYTSNQGSPVDSNLWRVKLDGSAPVKLTSESGTHDTLLSPDHQHFADLSSDLSTPPTARVCPVAANAAPACGIFWRSTVVPAATGVTSSIVTFTAADGKTKLYATLTLPADKTAPASIPLIMNPYGGPLPTPGVRNSWGAPFFDELMAQHGFAVLNVDNRGGGGRGRDLQQVAYDTFGPVQFSDQMAALDQALARYPQFDAKRIGWWGWSWGGSFTLYAMTHTDRIKAGVAVAPVTDFRNYDSIYTERYMGLPSDDKAGYDAASDVLSAAHLRGHLLIAQGTGDDNVHMANTIQFIEPLIDAGIPYDLQLFPRKTHSIAGMESRNELFERILAHFETYLK
jgi:dipeptidyl-peptidase-4